MSTIFTDAYWQGTTDHPERLLELARSIRSPWYRCQGLAIAACHFTRPDVREQIVDEALDVALLAGEASRTVTVSAWPINILVMDGRFDRLSQEIDRLLRLMATESNPVRRAEGLKHLLDAVVRGRRDVTIAVLEAFVSACVEPLPDSGRNHRGHSLLAEGLPTIARIDQRIASDVLSGLPGIAVKNAGERFASLQAGADDRLAAWQRLSVY